MKFARNLFIVSITILSVVGYAAVVFAVPFNPGDTLDPNCTPYINNNPLDGLDPDCTVALPSGGALTIGDLILGNPADQILYTDSSGNLVVDSGFTRDAITGETQMSFTAGDVTSGFYNTLSYLGADSFSGVSSVDNALGNKAFVGVSDNSTLLGLSTTTATMATVSPSNIFSTIFVNPGRAEFDINDDLGGTSDLILNPDEFSVNTLSGALGFRIDINGFQFYDTNGTLYALPSAAPSSGEVLGYVGANQTGWVLGSPISIGTSGNTLYSSGLTGTGQGETMVGANIFLGTNAGNSASDAYYSNFLGESAGQNATFATDANFFGHNAGYGATNATDANFFGSSSGFNATNAFGGNFFGASAGYGATNATRANFFGNNAGYGATGAYGSNFFGPSAGTDATSAYESNFSGVEAGYQATNAYYSNFFGRSAGSGAISAAASNFLGYQAGEGATNAYNSNFLGSSAGDTAVNAYHSNFFGNGAGNGATGAQNANFFGQGAGSGATGASFSNFLGYNAGSGATGASNSIFIGKSAGSSDTVNNTGNANNYSILIGPFTSTGGSINSIALGSHAVNTESNQLMIGSTTRPINEIVMVSGGGTTCATDINGTACSSDERLKTNITDLSTTTLDKVLNLRTVSFNWNDGSDINTRIGFIAQNMQQYFPELVSTGSTGYLSVNYAGMTPVLTEAIRELDLKITNIETFASTVNTTFIESVRNWLGDATNGIQRIVTQLIESDVVKAKSQLCVGDTCISEAEFIQIVSDRTSETGGGDSSAPIPILEDSEPVTIDESEPEQELEIVDEPSEEPEVLIESEPAPLPESTPILEPEPVIATE